MTTNSTLTSSSGGSPAFTTLLAIADGVLVRQVALFLTGREAAQLSLLSRGWSQFVQTHEEALFRDYLEQDFIEGAALINAVDRRKEQQQEEAQNGDGQGQTPCASTSFSYKQMYLAFHRRWKLPQARITKPGQSLQPIVVPWRNPYEFCEPPEEPSKDARALVFLVRVGRINDDKSPKTCGLLEWRDEDQLALDEDVRNIDDRSVDFPMLKKQVSQWIDGYRYNCDDDDDHDTLPSKVAKAISKSYVLTVHVVDLETCNVATLMENTPPSECEVLPDDTVDSSNWEMEAFYHGEDESILYGAKPPGSPFHMPFPDIVSFHRQISIFNAPEEHHLETFAISGSVCLRVGKAFRHLRDEDNDNVPYVDRSSGISFDFGTETTLVRRDEICSFLRALMREKCHPPPRPPISLVAPVIVLPHQPTWVPQATVLDTILSFSSFEEQAGDLRLVCRQFKDSAMRQLETLLDEGRGIQFDCRGWKCWVKGSVRRGWSNDPFGVSEDIVIQEALCMASCRCRTAFGEKKGRCPGMERCPGVIKTAVSGRGHPGFDMGEARKLLETKGWVNTTTDLPESYQNLDVKIHFEEGEKSLFCVCDDVVAAMDMHNAVPRLYADTPSSLHQFYGLPENMDSEKFIRSLFLLFVHTPYSDSDNEERPSKRAQVAKPSIGFANSCVDGYTRMKMIARFSTACGEPIEILLEGEGNL